MNDQPIPDEYERENEMVATAENNAPRAMLRAQERFDQRADDA